MSPRAAVYGRFRWSTQTNDRGCFLNHPAIALVDPWFPSLSPSLSPVPVSMSRMSVKQTSKRSQLAVGPARGAAFRLYYLGHRAVATASVPAGATGYKTSSRVRERGIAGDSIELAAAGPSLADVPHLSVVH